MLIDSSVEEEHHADSMAYPWDSGAVEQNWDDSVYPRSADANELLEASQMPVPDYRRYMAAFITMAFARPAEYLSSTRPPNKERNYPRHHRLVIEEAVKRKFGKTDLYTQAWTFEIAIRGSVRIGDRILNLIMDRRCFSLLPVSSQKALSEMLGDRVIFLDLPDDNNIARRLTETKCTEIICRYLGIDMPNETPDIFK
jgi:hypothetical protein